jgi:hypothetical protein
VFQHLQEATGKIKAVEDLSRYPTRLGWLRYPSTTRRKAT